MATILYTNEQFLIRPYHITEHGHLWDTFGNVETEASARYIVRLAQQRGNWHPFTREEIETVYREAGWSHGFLFNRLTDPVHHWIVKIDNYYFITEEFVIRLFEKARVREDGLASAEREE